MKNIIFSGILLFFCALNSFSQNWIWAKSPMGGGEANSVCTDAMGNVFVTGSFGSSLTFDSTILTSSVNSNIFIAKYDANGNVIWAKCYGGSRSVSISTDLSGNIFVTGWFYSPTITIGTTTLNNAGGNNPGSAGNGQGYPCSDMFIAKCDPTGNVLWAKSAGGIGNDGARSVIADANGNVFVTGFFDSSTITFGSNTLNNTNSSGENRNLFLTKYDSNGNVLWAQSLEGEGRSLSTDANGNVFLIRWFGAVFLTKYNTNGNILWAKSLPGYSRSLSTDSDGNVYVAGGFNGSSIITFDSTTLTGNGQGIDPFIAKYDMNGNSLWARTSGGTGGYHDYCHSIDTDANGNVFVTGYFEAATPSISFGSITLAPPLGSNFPVFIVNYDANGNVLCLSALAGGGADYTSVSAASLGNAYVVGTFSVNSLVVGADTLTLNGGESAFVAKYKCENYIVGAQTNILCSGECTGVAKVIVNGGHPPYSYLWAPGGQTTATITDLCAGTYTYTVADSIGNITTSNVIITQPTQLLLSETHTNLCNAQCTGTVILTASGGKPPYTFNGLTSGLCASSYTYAVTDANGCSATTTATITQAIEIIVSVTAENTSTFINSTTNSLTGTPEGGIFSGIGVSGTNFNPSIAGIGTWPVTYTYTDENGCTDSATINITVDMSTGIGMNGSEEAMLEIYPNPTSGIFILKLKNKTAETKICVYDVLGKCVFDKVSKNDKEKIDLSGQPKGIYTLEIESDGKSDMKKIVLQ